ncbi:MAG: prohibitin family protein [Bryobacterales bacterium]|nr:prohibitin family protein [Bryobacterales bacterium]MDE0628336.1 prohibitin family protein [Bryobacterales bacterium]
MRGDINIPRGSIGDSLSRILGGGIMPVVGLVVLVVVAFNSFQVVGAGERGVVFSKFGGVQEGVRGEGLQLKIPFIHTIITVDVRIQKSETDASASSKDLQTVHSRIALNYHIAPDEAARIYQEVGTLYKERLIDPSVQEAVKAATAQFTAEELITRRAEVSSLIKEMLAERLVPRNIVVDEFNIVDFNFSDVFNQAIEAKQTAEQEALKAQRDLERIKIEAEQKVTAATAEADSQRLQRETITESLLQLRAIEKWDGVLPQVTGGAVPFIDLNAISAR